MGKPDPVIYIAAMELIGLGKDEVLAVGDSLEHDISGKTIRLYFSLQPYPCIAADDGPER